MLMFNSFAYYTDRMRFLPFLMSQKRKEREEKSKVVRYILIGLGIFAALMLVGGGILAFIVFQDLPDLGDLDKNLAESTVILDRNGNELYKLYNDENRIYVPLDQVSTNFIHAILAAEDRKFYSHPGVDVIGIIRAQISNWRGNSTQGASTITQQLVKNLVLKDKSQNYIRKLREAVLAYELEGKYSKDKILELYINQSPFGGNSYGIQLAAHNYFSKDAKDLTVAESAVLASIPKGPTLYNPLGANPELLLGYCKVGGQGKNVGDIDGTSTDQTDVSQVVITARDKVWIKVAAVSDGKVAYEGTLDKGDQTSFAADQSYTISTGNKNFDMFVGATQVVLPKDQNFTFDPKSFQKKDDSSTPAPDSGAVPTGNASAGCSSMDDPNYVIGRKDFVLQGMMEEGFITKEQRDQAWAESFKLVFKRAPEQIKYPHFVMYVREYLEKKYGQDVGSKGYIVKTTIDPELQDLAQNIVKTKGDSYVKSGIDNAALVSVDPNTGEILTMVGSRDYWDTSFDGNVNVTVRKRQPGSSFKPFIYANLFEGPWGPGSVLWDVKTRFGGQYPNDYDGQFMGPLTIRKALAFSRNIPPIKAYFLNDGEEKTLDFLAKMGFGYLKDYEEQQNAGKADEDKFYYGYPIAIGAAEVRPLDMAAGYAAFANGGTYIEPTPILEITTSDGDVIEKMDPNRGKQVLDPQIAYEITSILSDAKARPAGFWASALTTPGVVTAAKTGTSNKRFGATIYPSDLWTVGYSRSISTAVWVGNNDGSKLKQNQDGLNFAAPIWKEFMLKAHADREKGDFPVPDGITKVTVSTLSGKRASKTTPAEFTTTDVFSSWAAPKEYDTTLTSKTVDKRNGLLAGDNCAPEITENIYVYNVHSERPTWKDWETPVLAWAAGKGFGSTAGSSDKQTIDVPKEMSDCKPPSADDILGATITYPKDAGLVQAGPVNVDVDISNLSSVTKAEYYVDGVLAATKTAAPFGGATVTVPSTDGTHTIKVIVYAGDQSAASSVAVKTGIDTSRPVVSISSPASGSSVVQGGTLNVAFGATDADSPVKRVDLYIDGRLLKSVGDGDHAIALTMVPSAYGVGSHTIKVFATDAVGNTSSAETDFTVTKSGGGTGTSTNQNGAEASVDVLVPATHEAAPEQNSNS